MCIVDGGNGHKSYSDNHTCLEHEVGISVLASQYLRVGQLLFHVSAHVKQTAKWLCIRKCSLNLLECGDFKIQGNGVRLEIQPLLCHRLE